LFLVLGFPSPAVSTAGFFVPVPNFNLNSELQLPQSGSIAPQ